MLTSRIGGVVLLYFASRLLNIGPIAMGPERSESLNRGLQHLLRVQGVAPCKGCAKRKTQLFGQYFINTSMNIDPRTLGISRPYT